MPDLTQSISKHDLGFIQIVARFWGIEPGSSEDKLGSDTAFDAVCNTIVNRSNLIETINRLTDQEKLAIDRLVSEGGRIQWAKFAREFGPIREMGPGRRDREKPYLSPVSVSEALWYRAIIFRGFFESPSGVDEYVYIADDVLSLLPKPATNSPQVLGRKALPKRISQILRSGEWILDHTCTLLSGIRSGLSRSEIEKHWYSEQQSPVPLMIEDLQLLLMSAGFIDSERRVIPDVVRDHFESDRITALNSLWRAWKDSFAFNDLRRVPGLIAEGEWRNDPLEARKFILELLSNIPPGEWWSLASFIDAVYQYHPDFQRPAGDYDSWYIRDQESGEYLRGFERWYDVDGALLRFVISGPLFWLGVVDLGLVTNEGSGAMGDVHAFRITDFGHDLINDIEPDPIDSDSEPLRLRSDGRIWASRRTSRAIRYQVARFCTWDTQKDDSYPYEITPVSLRSAKAQGLSTNHILNLLKNNADFLPPSLERALNRWDDRDTEARINQVTVLRVSHPEILRSLRQSKASRFLGDPLGPTATIVKRGAVENVRRALAEMGFLSEVEFLGSDDD